MSDGESEQERQLALEKETVATLLGQLLSTVTVWDRVRAAPIVENEDDYEIAVSDDGELLVRITPPEEYDAAISADHIDERGSWAELSVSGEGIGVSLYEPADPGRPILTDEWWHTHEEIQSLQESNRPVVIGQRGADHDE